MHISETQTSKEKMLEVAQGQLDAYNKRDLKLFLSFYQQDVKVYNLNKNELMSDQWEKFENMYRQRFDQNPNLNCQLLSRVVLNGTIIDEELVTGVEGVTTPSHVVAIYHFRDNKISTVFFTR